MKIIFEKTMMCFPGPKKRILENVIYEFFFENNEHFIKISSKKKNIHVIRALIYSIYGRGKDLKILDKDNNLILFSEITKDEDSLNKLNLDTIELKIFLDENDWLDEVCFLRIKHIESEKRSDYKKRFFNEYKNWDINV